MDESSPYLSPASAPPPVPMMQVPEPSSVKVFGVMHLVLAGIGLLSGVWGFVSTRFMSAFQHLSPSDPVAVAQMKYMEDLWPVTVMGSIFTLGLGALLLVSGLKLVRSQPDGILWSNRYAWLSITTKAVLLVVNVVYVLPIMNRMMGEVLGNTKGLPPAAAGTMTGMMKSMTTIGTVVGPVISCIYPALALYFLSRPAVKAWAGNTR